MCGGGGGGGAREVEKGSGGNLSEHCFQCEG